MADLEFKAIIEILLRGKGAEEAKKVMADLTAEAKRTGESLKTVAQRMATTAQAEQKLTAATQQQAAASKQATASTAAQAAATTTLGTGAKTATTGVTGLGMALKGLFPALGLLALVSKAFQFLKQSILGTADEARTLNALRIQIEAMGIEGGPSLEVVRAGLVAIEKAGGAVLSTTLPVFQKLIGITRDTAAAFELTALAARIEESGMLDAAAAGEALANILQGRAALAAKALGIQVSEGATAVDVFTKALEQFGPAVAKIDDTRDAMDRTTGAFKEAGRQLAGFFAPAIDLVAGKALPAFIDGLRTLGVVVGTTIKSSIAAFVGLGQTVAASLNLKQLALDPSGYIESVKAAATSGLAVVGDLLTEAQASYEAIWAKGGADSAQAAVDARTAILQAAAEADARRVAEETAKATAAAIKAEQEKAAQIEEERKRAIERYFADEVAAAEERTRRTVAAEQDLLRARIGAAEEGSAERLKLELELLDREYQERIRRADGNEQEITALRLAHATNRADLILEAELAREQTRQALLGELRDAETEAAMAVLEDRIAQTGNSLDQILQLEIEAIRLKRDAEIEAAEAEAQARIGAGEDVASATAISSSKILGITRRAAAEERKITAATQKEKRALYAETAIAVFGALKSIFGQNKAFAVAEAIIQTYQGVAMALGSAPPPYNFILAAAVAAAGLANVRKIVATEPGDTSASAGGGAGAGTAQVPRTVRQPSTIGSPEAAPQQAIPSFDGGGVVPGPTGSPMMAVLHGGETVLTPEQVADLNVRSRIARLETKTNRLSERDERIDDRIDDEATISRENINDSELRLGRRDVEVDKASVERDERLSWRISNIVRQLNEDRDGILGFAHGGIVPGPPGAARMIVAHGGEGVVPASNPLMRALFPSGATRPSGSTPLGSALAERLGDPRGAQSPSVASHAASSIGSTITYDQREEINVHGFVLAGRPSEWKAFLREQARQQRRLSPPRRIR